MTRPLSFGEWCIVVVAGFIIVVTEAATILAHF
jgi:hypothetical protein